MLPLPELAAGWVRKLGAVVLGARRDQANVFPTMSPLQDALVSFSSASAGAWARYLLTVLPELQPWFGEIPEDPAIVTEVLTVVSRGRARPLYGLESLGAGWPAFLKAPEFLGRTEFPAGAETAGW